MDLKGYEENVDNFTPVSQFTNRLKTMNEQIDPMLADYQKAYLFYNVNPSNPEYQKSFENIKNNVGNANANLFKLSNTVSSETDNINDNLAALYEEIEQEKQENKKLKRKLGMSEHKNHAANVMITNYAEIYNAGYTRNWAIILSTIAVGVAISKVFREKVV